MNLYTIDCVLHYKMNKATNMLLQIQVAQHPDQLILNEKLSFNMPIDWHEFQDVKNQNRHIRFHVEPCDALQIHYSATVQHAEPPTNLHQRKELDISELPDEVLPYLLASRYCDVDRLMGMVKRTFSYMDAGYIRIQAIEHWIFHHIYYESGSSDENTVASDVLLQRAGVCRDFAHLAISICRALGIPARMVVGYVEIEKFSPDFHAICEVYLEGGWVLFDPTRLAEPHKLVRVATGIDASDVAFATYYGELELLKIEPKIQYRIFENVQKEL